MLGAVMHGLERAIPDSSEIVEFLRAERPDLVMISPLVKARPSHASQADYVRAARSLGLRSALLVRSWDNLTNKGLIHEPTDRVYVWNDYQRREAVELHGVPDERVVPTGAYPWDHWFDWEPSTSSDEFRRRLGFTAGLPLVLYVCSSRFVAPNESPFVERWLRALRGHSDECLRTANVLIRPHPSLCSRWRESPLTQAAGVAVWPLEGPLQGRPPDDEWKSWYFDSIFHSSAVVGLNTSAMIEAAIVGRPVFTILSPEYRDTQEGTLHFHYLLRRNGGPATLGRDFPEHLGQLAHLLSGDHHPALPDRDFVRRFVRPLGLHRPALATLIEALEEQMVAPPPRPLPARTRRSAAAVVLRPAGAAARWSVRSGAA
jgi:hypothetical protein